MRLIFRIFKQFFKYVFLSFLLFNILIVIISSFFSPTCNANTKTNKYDLIIVLGSPATENCTPSTILKDRIDKGIALYKQGLASKILFSGSNVHNRCTEADVMAVYAEQQGVLEADIIKEARAENTYQNAFYSVDYMHKNHLKTAAIVTSQPHVKRACIVFSKFDVSFAMYGANQPKNSSKTAMFMWSMGERMILAHHIVFGFPTDF